MLTLSNKQDQAVRSIQSWFHNRDRRSFYLAGFAGSGKTSILPQIVESTNLKIEDIAFAAPTAKAAKVMTGKLKNFGIFSTARTIHSMMYIPRSTTVEGTERKIDEAKEELLSLKGDKEKTKKVKRKLRELKSILSSLQNSYESEVGFILKGTFGSLECSSPKLIILDESSMIGMRMGTDILGFDIPTLLVGDPAQLTPVGDKSFLSGRPDFFLDEIHRQARDNPIIHLSTLAREGKKLPLGKLSEEVKVVKRRDDDITLDMDNDAQVIVGTNRKRWKITDKIRSELGYDTTGPGKGEPLMVVKNNYLMSGFINGLELESTCNVGDLIDGDASYKINVMTEDNRSLEVTAFQPVLEEHIHKEKGVFSCSVDDAKLFQNIAVSLDYNWVSTAHKFQGSQARHICVHDESKVFGRDTKNWLYTAITRAEEALCVVVPTRY